MKSALRVSLLLAAAQLGAAGFALADGGRIIIPIGLILVVIIFVVRLMSR